MTAAEWCNGTQSTEHDWQRGRCEACGVNPHPFKVGTRVEFRERAPLSTARTPGSST
jgi:hypothetical protein